MTSAGAGASTLVFDGDNSYPGCKRCGHCCEINILAVTGAELARMRAFAREHEVLPADFGGADRCPFLSDEGSCRIWEARPQVCRLATCQAARFEVRAARPDIVVPDDIPLVDLRAAFLFGDDSDPRSR